jgi:hypothetical protein
MLRTVETSFEPRFFYKLNVLNFRVITAIMLLIIFVLLVKRVPRHLRIVGKSPERIKAIKGCLCLEDNRMLFDLSTSILRCAKKSHKKRLFLTGSRAVLHYSGLSVSLKFRKILKRI